MKIGLLPLYIELYDRVVPEIRPRLEKFYETIAGMIEERGFQVVRSPFCRLRPEFEAAVADFEKQKAQVIVTLHMAYSPSLESIDALCSTKLPIVVLDTTETLEFTNICDSWEIMFNHGIHGVMDLCSMLTRRGKPYAIAAGHWQNSDVVDRACGYIRAAIAADSLIGARVGLVGGAFEGMGDFRVDYDELKKVFGITVEQMDAARMSEIYDALTEDEVDREKEENDKAFEKGNNIIEEEYDLSVRSCLALRKYVEEKGLDSFSVNFTQVGREASGLTSMPFIECCKAMTRGIGYAGEGDTLTAAFTGAFLQGWADASFVEIFCPDWKNDMVFISHMGEVNYNLAAIKPEINRVGTNYSPAAFPYVAYTRMKGGKGAYVNVSRGKEGYRITVAEAELIDYDEDTFAGWMRGWMKLRGCTTAEFLEGLSRNGATHHSVFVTGADADAIEYFGKLIGVPVTVL